MDSSPNKVSNSARMESQKLKAELEEVRRERDSFRETVAKLRRELAAQQNRVDELRTENDDLRRASLSGPSEQDNGTARDETRRVTLRMSGAQSVSGRIEARNITQHTASSSTRVQDRVAQSAPKKVQTDDIIVIDDADSDDDLYASPGPSRVSSNAALKATPSKRKRARPDTSTRSLPTPPGTPDNRKRPRKWRRQSWVGWTVGDLSQEKLLDLDGPVALMPGRTRSGKTAGSEP